MVNAIKLEMHKSQTSSNGSNNFALVLPDAQAAYANEVFPKNELKLLINDEIKSFTQEVSDKLIPDNGK